MNLVQRLMGRRQFLIAAGVASTCALNCKKLAGFQTRTAMAAEQAATASVKAAGNRCPHLLSPLKIRNRVLKNRIMHTVSPVYTLQGPENYPTDAWRNHYSNMAKNAAIVTINYCFGKYPKTYHTKDDPIYWSWEHISNNKWEDIPPVYNYVERMIEDIHCEGALVLFDSNAGDVGEAIVAGDSSGQSGAVGMGGPGVQTGMPGGAGPQAPASKSIEEIVKGAKEAVENGYDVYQMTNPSLEAVQTVRNTTNLVIISSLGVGRGRGMGQRSANIPGIVNTNKPTAAQIEQAVESARKLEGLADIVLIRGGSCGNWVQEKDELLSNYYYAEAIKKAGIKVITCISGGYYDPIKNDEYIARGITDMVGMTRPLFADADVVKKVSAGRADDVIPCIQCQNCHAVSMTKGPHYAACTVNPKWAAPIYKLTNIHAPLIKKKVAVIGGGPAGMKAAIVAAERGHQVTLYEKDTALGGLQKHTDYTKWNWTYKVFKDWLINQVKKAGIEVQLKTTATPAMIKAKGYDTVLVALGAKPVVSRMPGADAGNVFNILTCYSNKKALGKNVVMIGAGKIGTEAAVSMVKDGHKVTVLAPGEEMIDPKDIGPHSVTHQENIYKNHPDFKYFMKTMVKSITGGKVTYKDSKGAEKSIKADSIVIWSGLKPRTEEAVNFSGSADEVLLLGDCTGDNGRILKTIRSAFYVASQV
ncbi:FAD-dependent oxidoreductase [Deltaproteobacteria bacterium]|nr:FAD-dependent oxidoreductase [Deltaproteobacteria bacterium]